MPTEAERNAAQFQAMRADKDVLEAAAACLRYEAIQQYYAGFQRKEIALGFAALLDGMALRLRMLDQDTRHETVSMCRELLHRIERDETSYHHRVAAGRQA